MYTYALLSVPFFVIVLLLDIFILRTRVVANSKTWKVMLFLLLMTAVFDQFLTGLPIVLYNEANLSGVRLWYAPIEDFTYTVAVVLLVGSTIEYGTRKNWL